MDKRSCQEATGLTMDGAQMQTWQRRRYSSDKFQLHAENPHAGCAGDVQTHNQIQKDIFQVQHPENCSGRFLIWKLGTGGFGQEVRKLAYQLAIAQAENRTLILDTSLPWKYTDKEVCPQQDLSCFFLPLSSCSLHHVIVQHPQLSSISLPTWTESNLEEPVVVGQFNTDKWRFYTPSKFTTTLTLEWYRSELLYYIMRPNEFTENLVREEKVALGMDPSKESYLCLAMHVRSGDKRTEYKVHSFLEYLAKAQWFNALYGIKDIFLVTDDHDVIEQAKTEPNFHIFWSRGTRSVGGSHEHSEVGHEVMVKVLKDVLIASQCQLWVGTLSSNFGDIIWELMIARNFGVVPPYVSLDVPWKTHDQPNVFI